MTFKPFKRSGFARGRLCPCGSVSRAGVKIDTSWRSIYFYSSTAANKEGAGIFSRQGGSPGALEWAPVDIFSPFAIFPLAKPKKT